MTIKLLSLRLHAFKGARDLHLEFDGLDASIYGPNASLKSTVADAFTWLLLGRDTSGAAEFSIKTLDKSGEAIHHQEHSVEAALSVDGVPLKLKRGLREKWSRKKGSATESFTGHEGWFEIDGVAVPEAQFNAKVASLCRPDLLPVLLSPEHFPRRMKKQERRALLVEMAGDIQPATIFAANPELQPLEAELHSRSVADFKAIIQSQSKKVNQELATLPGRIDEAGRATACSEDPAEAEAAAKSASGAVDDAVRAEAALEERGATAGLKLDLKLAQATVRGLEQAAQGDLLTEVRKVQEAVAEADRELLLASDNLDAVRRKIAAPTLELERLRASQSAKEAEWKRVAESALPTFDIANVCAACGQSLPAERVQAAKDAAVAEFNAKKAETLAAIHADQDILARGVKRCEAEIAEAKRSEGSAVEVLAEARKKATDAKGAFHTASGAAAQAQDSDALVTARKAVADIQAKLDKAQQVGAESLAAAKRATEERRQALRAAMERQAAISAAQAARQRVAELEATLKRQGAEYERLQHLVYLCDQYVMALCNALDERVNSLFRHARVQLFDQLINGGIAEAVTVTYQGVPYDDLNNAAKVNVGLDIVRAVSKHFGVWLPLFVDGAESVTRLIEMPGTQVIRLVVSGEDKDLRLELNNAREMVLVATKREEDEDDGA